MEKKQLRQYCRHARQQARQHVSDQAMCDLFLASPEYQSSTTIACYHAMADEISPKAIIDAAWADDKQVYLPVCVDDNLVFVKFTPETEMTANRYGILEPVVHELIHIEALDLVCCPLLGFDGQGHRLGMGKGYYDKSFASLIDMPPPYLIGLAFEVQKVEHIPVDNWDVSLYAVCTESQFYRF